MKRIALALGLLLCLAVPALAQELKDKTRPAEAADLVGTWDVIYQAAGANVDPEVLKKAPWQRFRFQGDGTAQTLTSSNPPDNKAALPILDKESKPARYEVQKPGVLTIIRSPEEQDVVIVSVVTADFEKPQREDAPLLKTGDLLLASMTPEKKPYLHRYLRKVQ